MVLDMAMLLIAISSWRFLTLRGSGDSTAVAYMLTGIVGLSVVPAVIILSGGSENPFFFNFLVRLGFVVSCILFVLISSRHRKSIDNSTLIAMTWRRLYRDCKVMIAPRTSLSERVLAASIPLTALHAFDYAILAWAVSFVDVAIAAVIYEIWPMTIIFLTARLISGRYARFTLQNSLYLGCCFVGVGFVILSSRGEINLADNESIDIIIGMALTLSGVLTTTLAVYGFRWGAVFNQSLVKRGYEDHDGGYQDLVCVIIAHAISSTLALPVIFMVAVISNDTLVLGKGSMLAVVGGVMVALASICLRKANVITTNLGVNAIAYGTPILSLLWLSILSATVITRPDLIIIGTIIIITANLLINFEADIRLGFKSMILALWGCGAFVYLRDDLLHHLPFASWLWPGEIYLGALALSATVFILLLSFRVARLAARTQDEDNRIFALFQNVDILIRRNLIDSSVREHVLTVDGSHSPEELQSAYRQAKLCFAQAVDSKLDNDDQERLAVAEAQLNTIVHSRRHGIEFGELFALIIFGGITVLLGLLSRPAELSSWPGFMFEVFAMSFSAVIVFLIVNVWDLQRDRSSRILHRQPDHDGYGVAFRDATSRRFEQGTSIVIGLAITVAYAGLLWHKWLT